MSRDVGRIEFGDFQTPVELARQVCALIYSSGFRPATILEPTCGIGAFVQASLKSFPNAKRVIGFDLNPHYVERARANLNRDDLPKYAKVRIGDFYDIDWEKITLESPQPLLILGNPPWVTNATLGSIRGTNAPRKTNVDNLRGIDAITGKSNFDISEWMLRQNLIWLNGKHGMLAVLCKTAVARKVLAFAWAQAMQLASASIYRIDSKKHFDVSVDACLLIIELFPESTSRECLKFSSLEGRKPISMLGTRHGRLVADVARCDQWEQLWSKNLRGWRSGVKHDLAEVFELTALEQHRYLNGSNETVRLEPEVVFPLLKSSDLASRRKHRKWVLLPQRSTSEPPSRMRITAPHAWSYLLRHASAIEKRRSIVYRKRPPFSIFGIGDYSFAPWKIAVSGLYKKLEFVLISPVGDKPVMLDDTCYFFPCESKQEAGLLLEMLASQPAREFLSAHIFWDSKRPITAKLLNSLDLLALSGVLGLSNAPVQSLIAKQRSTKSNPNPQQCLFEE